MQIYLYLSYRIIQWDQKSRSSGKDHDPCLPGFKGSEPFSEPETAAVRDLILREKPKSFIFFHASHLSQVNLKKTYILCGT